MSLSRYLSAVWTYSSASNSYTNRTLESSSRKGTSFTILATTNDYVYFGAAERFDALFFMLDTEGSLGTLTWQYYDGSSWVSFAPDFDKIPENEDGYSYDFSRDGGEIFNIESLSGWATLALTSSVPHNGATPPDGTARYWIRLSSQTSVSTSPKVFSVQRRLYASYCEPSDVAEFLNLKFSFSTTSVPTFATVENYIRRASDYIDRKTRRSWRPNIGIETHEFNIHGIKLGNLNAYRVTKLEIWDGGSWEVKTESRTNDWFFLPSTNMVVFSRFFLLPARFQGFNYSPGWGGGEFRAPVRITYLYGSEISRDLRYGNMIRDSAVKLTAIDIMTNHDYAKIIASGSDRILPSQKIQNWQMEVDNKLELAKAWEVF